MEHFSLSPGGKFLHAEIESSLHGNLGFRLSTVAAGNLSINKTREREIYLHEVNIPVERVAYFHQTHSKLVEEISSKTASPVEADGGVTIDPDVILSVTVADCLPIALFDTEGGGFALLHSGWRGTGIAVVALDRMRRLFDTGPGNVMAVIGPGIGSCCYNVPEERAAGFGALGEGVVHRREGAVYLDLKEANRIMLRRAGVENIAVSSLCTCCSDNLGSYRRQGAGIFTSMLVVVGHF